MVEDITFNVTSCDNSANNSSQSQSLVEPFFPYFFGLKANQMVHYRWVLSTVGTLFFFCPRDLYLVIHSHSFQSTDICHLKRLHLHKELENWRKTKSNGEKTSAFYYHKAIQQIFLKNNRSCVMPNKRRFFFACYYFFIVLCDDRPPFYSLDCWMLSSVTLLCFVFVVIKVTHLCKESLIFLLVSPTHNVW